MTPQPPTRRRRSVPAYPPKVRATILAFETGKTYSITADPEPEGAITAAEVAAEVEQDMWRSLMQNDDQPYARVIA